MQTFIFVRIAWHGASVTQPSESVCLPSTVESGSLLLSPQPQRRNNFIEIMLEMY